MQALGLRPVPECACLFTNKKLIVFFYVDDIVVLFHRRDRQSYEAFRRALMSHFQLREIGELKWFLGIRILRDQIYHKIWLCQDLYVAKVAKTFNLEHRKAKTPMITDHLFKNEQQATPIDVHRYQRKVRLIRYPASITRPDICYTL
jgi:hypothetical protein